MAKLELSIAVGNYDRMQPLLDGRVRIDGVDPVFMALSPEEMFFRAFRHEEFDVSELSLSSYLIKLSQGRCPYIAVPVFPSRAFRHTSIYVRRDRIQCPHDLIGARIGIPEFQLTAIVWARALLEDDYRITYRDLTWVRGGIDVPGRTEKIGFRLPDDVRLEDAPAHETISAMLDRGELDGFIAPRPPGGPAATNPNVGWLFPDPSAEAKQYFRRTGIFPIMHLLAVRRELAERHPWLPGALLKASERSKSIALEDLGDTSAAKVTLPFVEEQLKAAFDLMGRDFWSYGVQPNVKTLEAFTRHHHAQGLSARRVGIEEMFHPSTYEAYKI